jgi:uncharacterized membrane protein YbhN (UPF0104 family)
MEEKNMHFKSIFGYVVGISVSILAYVVAVTFLNIPEKNARFVDIAFGFLLNIFGNSAAYLIGGNPTNSKKNDERTTDTNKGSDINPNKGE